MIARQSACHVAAALCLLLGLPVCGRGQVTHAESLPAAPEAGSATLSGVVTDTDGGLLPGARIELLSGGISFNDVADADGAFRIYGVPPGAYELHVVADGFEAQDDHGQLEPAEQRDLTTIQLRPSSTQQVSVVASQHDIATAQMNAEMTQRVLGFIPNFYVVYFPNPAPLTAGQKFHLAWRSTVDPISFLGTGITAAIDQSTDSPSGWGKNPRGFAQRYGAEFANDAIGTFLGGYALPALLHQDPRYFYQGTGSVYSRTKHAMLSVIITHGDNGKPEFNYSNILGGLASAGISNLYYPAASRNGPGLTFENEAVGLAFGAFGAIMQEFVVPKLTPHRPGKATPAPKATAGF